METYRNTNLSIYSVVYPYRYSDTRHFVCQSHLHLVLPIIVAACISKRPWLSLTLFSVFSLHQRLVGRRAFGTCLEEGLNKPLPSRLNLSSLRTEEWR
jgi:hypothetical protein